MRIACLLAVLTLLAPLAASAPTAGGPLLTDVTGDVALGFTGTPVTGPGGANQGTAGADLVSLEIVESDETLQLALAISGFSGTGAGSEYLIGFAFRGVDFVVDAFWFNGFDGGAFCAASLGTAEGSDINTVAELAPTCDPATGKVTLELAKPLVMDASRHTLTRGDVLTKIRVESVRSIGLGATEIQATDSMPDSGDGASFEVLRGDEATGTVGLVTEERQRVSNGGATTFLYRATVVNKADHEDSFALAVTDLPAGWNGTVPSPVKVPAKASREVTVLASVPFAHVHGGSSSFNVTAVSQSDPASKARLRLGVLHTPIPQPAGHHSDLFLHGRRANQAPLDSAFTYSTFWLNTEEAHDADPADVPPNECSDANSHQWNIALNPSLQMGMDWDIARVGTVAGNLFARATGTGRMEAKVWLTKTSKNETSPNGVIVIPKGSTLLASGKQDGLAFDLQAPSAFKVTLTPTPESDYIPYQSGQNLWLSLEMFNDMDGPTFSCSGSADSPGIGTDGLKMSLPLEEYQDRLEGVSEAASILDLKALGPVEKLARPGTLMTYSFTLSNAGFSADDFVTEATGPDASIATVVPGGTIHLDAKGSVQVTLGVKVPEKAVDNQAYEVVLFVHSKSDPTKSVVARTKTIAALHGDATADETRLLKAAQDDAKKTPGLEALGVLALVGIVAYARRR